MVKLLDYLLFEDLADDIENLENRLRRAFGVSSKEIRQLYKKADQKAEPFYQLLKQKNKELEDQQADGVSGPDDEEDISSFKVAGREPEQLSSSMEYDDHYEQTRHEAVVNVLKYLQDYFGGKDRVRVIAARFGVDPDVYFDADLGHLPENYTDKDVWDTMDRSGHGKKPFKNSIWQPLYIAAEKELMNLPDDVKERLAVVAQKGQEVKRDVHYPVRTDRPFHDVGMTFEGRSLDDIIVEDDNIFYIISKGTFISVVG